MRKWRLTRKAWVVPLAALVAIGIVVALAFYVRGFQRTGNDPVALSTDSPAAGAPHGPSAPNRHPSKHAPGTPSASGSGRSRRGVHTLVAHVKSSEPIGVISYLVPTSPDLSFGKAKNVAQELELSDQGHGPTEVRDHLDQGCEGRHQCLVFDHDRRQGRRPAAHEGPFRAADLFRLRVGSIAACRARESASRTGSAGWSIAAGSTSSGTGSAIDSSSRCSSTVWTCVLDIGANVGQFGRDLRRAKFAGRILSVEPLRGAYRQLEAELAVDPAWTAERAAVSDQPGTLTMNVAGNSVSSSVLPMRSEHVDAAPAARYVNTEEVTATTVDDLVVRHKLDPASTLLKIDVQGYEKSVLDGAEQTLPRFAAVRTELSLVPLYDGQALMPEMMAYLDERGFDLWFLERGFTDPHTRRVLQLDGVFFRRPTETLPADRSLGST